MVAVDVTPPRFEQVHLFFARKILLSCQEHRAIYLDQCNIGKCGYGNDVDCLIIFQVEPTSRWFLFTTERLNFQKNFNRYEASTNLHHIKKR